MTLRKKNYISLDLLICTDCTLKFSNPFHLYLFYENFQCILSESKVHSYTCRVNEYYFI